MNKLRKLISYLFNREWEDKVRRTGFPVILGRTDTFYYEGKSYRCVRGCVVTGPEHISYLVSRGFLVGEII